MASFTFRHARSSDAPLVWAVRTDAIRSTCSSHYPKEIIDSWSTTAMPDTFGSVLEKEQFVVAELNGEIVGFAGLKTEAREVDAVFVSPSISGTGLGWQLLKQVETQARKLGFKTITLHASLNAVLFYLRSGYSEVGKGFHSSKSGLQIACVHMEKQLDSVA